MLTFDDAIARLVQYQDALDEARAKGGSAYDAVFDAPPAGVGAHEIDAKGVVQRVNAEELAILGYRADQMMGQLIAGFIVLSKVSQQAIEHKLRDDWALVPFSRTFRRADGSHIYLAMLDRHLREASSGRVIGIRTAMMPAKPLCSV